jgi:hypothetical protein
MSPILYLYLCSPNDGVELGYKSIYIGKLLRKLHDYDAINWHIGNSPFNYDEDDSFWIELGENDPDIEIKL